MSRNPGALLAATILSTSVLAPTLATAQAFTPPQGVGAVTLGAQYVDNTGHRLTDGTFRASGQSVTTSIAAELEYGVTDRLTAWVAVPYVFARYTGSLPPPSGLALDACRCWHSGLQDLSVGARYRFGNGNWAVTPLVKGTMPTHEYTYRGEAAVGRNLREAQVGLSVGAKLAGVLPQAGVQATYMYAFVERALDDIAVDRSNLFVDLGYALGSRLYVRAGGSGLWTHGGLRAGSVTGRPFRFPGELNTPERFAERDRLLRVKYWQVGAGASYAAGPVDVFASVTKYVWGRDAHNGQIYNLGATWYFHR